MVAASSHPTTYRYRTSLNLVSAQDDNKKKKKKENFQLTNSK